MIRGIVYSWRMPKRYPILLLLLLLPLLFIYVKDSHDWGDDFAQYLIQAKNIIEGKPQTSNHLLFDENSGRFAVKAYPVGFPLMLSPAVAISDICIQPLLILESIFLIALAILCFYYFKKHFPAALSFLLVVFFAYHVESLNLKAQILSEIPFTLALFSIFLLLKSGRKEFKFWILCATLCAVLASIRIVGFLIIPSVGAFLLYNYILRKNSDEYPNFSRLKIFSTIAFLSIALFLFLNSFLFNIDLKDFGGFYQDVLVKHPFNLIKNLDIYIQQTGFAFRIPVLHFSWWGFFCICVILLGFIRTFLHKNSAAEWFFVFYILLLGLYPYTSGGFRFLFPIFPLLIVYFVEGFKSIFKLLGESAEKKFVYVPAVLLLLNQLIELNNNWQDKNQLYAGPQSPAAVEMFDYIRNNTDSNDLLVFPRARAIALYTGRPVTYLLQKNSSTENAYLFNKLKVQYLILPKKRELSPLFDAALWNYVGDYSSTLRTQWENNEFVVYKLIH